MKRQISISRLVATLGVAMLGTSAAWAQNQTEPQAEVGSAPAVTGGEPAARHCIAELSPVAEGAKESATGKVTCHATFAAAMAAATQNTVALAADATPESLKEADVVAAATRIIGIDYDGAYYTGASFIWYATNIYGCYGGRSYVANMPGYFNNRLTSTRGFSGCYRNTSYDGYWQTGSWVRCFPNCYYVGGFMTNRTSSKRWSW
jgi:hypothetical protein